MSVDAELRAELEAYKASVTPATGSRVANWEAIARRALRGEGPEWIDDPEVVARSWRITTAAVPAAIATAAAALALLLHAPDLLSRADASYEAMRSDRFASVAAGTEELEAGEPVVPVTEIVSTDAECTPDDAPAVRSIGARAREPSAPTTRLARIGKARVERLPQKRSATGPLEDIRAESLLVGRARAALRDEDAIAASRLLDEHARRFPSGELEQERELLRIATLCDREQTDAARRAAQRFRGRFSGSPLLGHLSSTCAGAL